jgi:hypothetical protein
VIPHPLLVEHQREVERLYEDIKPVSAAARRLRAPIVGMACCEPKGHVLGYLYRTPKGPLFVTTGDEVWLDKEALARARRAFRQPPAMEWERWEPVSDLLDFAPDVPEAHPPCLRVAGAVIAAHSRMTG